MTTLPTTSGLRRFPCVQCGAQVVFEPGTTVLKCPYCSAENPIPEEFTAATGGADALELDYAEHLDRLEQQAPTQVKLMATCESCHATVDPPPEVTSFACPFCGTNIVATQQASQFLLPNAILPFKLPREKATDLYRRWITSRWFAPNRLKSQSMLDESLKGMYVPAWTYDASTTTRYTGQRGDTYYVTETVIINGKPQSRQVPRIRWSSASGTVNVPFNDVLVKASDSLPDKLLWDLSPWDLQNVVPYADDYLAGFAAERYQTGLKAGFEVAQRLMQPGIDRAICADIGGDQQRIESKRTGYADITFKHLLLPVWVSAYRYNGTVFRFLINARTGEVQGQRPYSWIKIALAVIAGLIVIGIIVAVAGNR